MAKKSTLKLAPIDLGKETIGQRIARLRKERGYSQQALADNMGIVRVLVSDYEKGRIRPHPEMVARFALAFGITTDELIGLKPSKGNGKKPNLSIQKRIRKIEELPPAKQRVILQTIDAFIRGVK
ncbi:MAG: helix-turn-helix transcriptional regulator [Desulfobacteraceae bacterium]|jgi:transcriptional regulator with XRE-family HTH domain